MYNSVVTKVDHMHVICALQIQDPCLAFMYHGIALLVCTHVVCERLSAMQERARLGAFLVQNTLSAPTQAFEECGAQKIVRDVGRLGWSWSRVPHPQIP